MEEIDILKPEEGKLKYDKGSNTLYVSFYDTEKGKWISLTIEKLKEKSKYFPEDDILWVTISDKGRCEGEYFSGGFIVDFDEDGEPAGLEIFGWKKFFDT